MLACVIHFCSGQPVESADISLTHNPHGFLSACLLLSSPYRRGGKGTLTSRREGFLNPHQQNAPAGIAQSVHQMHESVSGL